jgi:hypothetical protein
LIVALQKFDFSGCSAARFDDFVDGLLVKESTKTIFFTEFSFQLEIIHSSKELLCFVWIVAGHNCGKIMKKYGKFENHHCYIPRLQSHYPISCMRWRRTRTGMIASEG